MVMTLVEISTITTIAAAIGVLIGAFLAVLQLRNITSQRRANTLLSLVPQFRPDGGEKYLSAARLIINVEFKNFDEFVQLYGNPDTSDHEVVKAAIYLCGYYEGLGILYKRNLIDRELVSEFYGYDPVDEWMKMKPLIIEMRKRKGDPRAYEYFEFFASDLQKRVKKSNQNE